MATHIITPTDNITAILGELDPGDVLLMRGGTYNYGAVNVGVSGNAEAPIEIAAYPGEHVLWQTGARDEMLNITGSHIIISTIEFDKEDGARYALRLRGNHITVRECHIHNCRYYTMIRVDGNDCALIGNQIHNNGYGPDTDAHAILNRGGADRLTLLGNTIYDVSGDCYQSEATEGAAQDIVIANNRMYTTLGWRSENAVDIKAGSGEMRNNTVYGFRDSHPPAGEGGDYPSGSSGAGLLVHKGAARWLIEDNFITDCTIGIRVIHAPTNDVMITNNIITDIAWDDPQAWMRTGIQVDAAQDVSIIANTFDEPRERALRVHPGVMVAYNTFEGAAPTTTTTTSTSTSTTSTTSTTTSTTTATATSTTTLIPPGPGWQEELNVMLDGLIDEINEIKRWAEGQ
jgi:hypothetical protein